RRDEKGRPAFRPVSWARLSEEDVVGDWETVATGGASWSVVADVPTWSAEDSTDCGGPNPGQQTGSAKKTFVLSVPTRLTFNLTGLVEKENAPFDLGTVLVDGEPVIQLHGF